MQRDVVAYTLIQLFSQTKFGYALENLNNFSQVAAVYIYKPTRVQTSESEVLHRTKRKQTRR